MDALAASTHPFESWRRMMLARPGSPPSYSRTCATRQALLCTVRRAKPSTTAVTSFERRPTPSMVVSAEEVAAVTSSARPVRTRRRSRTRGSRRVRTTFSARKEAPPAPDRNARVELSVGRRVEVGDVLPPEREKAICETRPVKRGRAADSHLCDDLARVLTLAALCNHLEACKVAALATEEDLGRVWCETERVAGSAVRREVASIRIVCGRVAEGAPAGGTPHGSSRPRSCHRKPRRRRWTAP